ncbi:MAG: Rid family detoxifying hydrolase [Saprospiraceae bacterium]|nr:Rid family detoxifying hydrolase [Saprospiraceae bacterium]MCB9318812.1 RidA family protein [Lewinellaceae bacterium]
MLQPVYTSTAATPGGHYSQAVIHGETVYISGLLPILPEKGEKVLGSMQDQLNAIFGNLEAILQAAGSARDAVIRTTVYISDISLWSEVNAKYKDYFGDHKPARTVVPVPELHYGFKIEIDAIAAVLPG